MRILGSVGEPQIIRNGWSQQLGDYVEYVYKGSQAYATSVFQQLRGNCADVEVELQDAVGVVRARFAGTTQPGGEEEARSEIRLTINAVQKSIFEPGPDGVSNVITDQELRYIKALIDDPLDDEAFAWLADNGTDTGDELYSLAQRGVEYRTVYQPLIQHISTASSLYNWSDKTAWSGKVLSEANMRSLWSITPNFTIPTAPDAAPDGFSYGWKFAPPTYEAASDGHTSEVLEFEFGLWPDLLYDFVP